nr:MULTISPECIES: RHS repeat-associated core domain-containing protein [Acinetobacter]
MKLCHCARAFGLGNPTASITFNLRFPGQYYDVGTNQFYNPELGRYMEPDPIGLAGGSNPYAYAGSNPIMNNDSKGLKLEPMNFDQMMRFDLSQLENPLLNTRMWDLQLKNINLIGNSRGLSDGEIKMSQPVFGNKIDYSQPRVFNRPWLNNPLQSRAMAPDGNIYYPKDKYREDFSTQKLGERATFIHEMTHVMQFQNGISVIGEGKSLQWNYMVNNIPVYDYIFIPNKPFNGYNIEQQGQIAEDIYRGKLTNIIKWNNWSY